VTREPDPTGFDDIVASWQREGGVPQWPEDDLWPAVGRTPPDDLPAEDLFTAELPPDERVTDDQAATADPVPVDDRIPADGGEPPSRPPEAAADPLVEEHFVPPEPPPLPRLGPPILVGLTLIALGLVLVSFPGWVGVPQVYGLPLGLVAIAAGLGWLVLRLWPDNADDGPPPIYLDDPDDPDGGAVL
jgi:hypothetical protein